MVNSSRGSSWRQAGAAFVLFGSMLILYLTQGRLPPEQSDQVPVSNHAFVKDDNNNTNSSSLRLSFEGDPLYRDYQRFQCIRNNRTWCADAEATTQQWIQPMALIAGTQKGGTRALLTYLHYHPAIYNYQGRETKILHNAFVDNPYEGPDQVDQCRILKVYHQEFAAKYEMNENTGFSWQTFSDKGATGFFDKSPSYMLDSEHVPQRFTCVLPQGKIILLLRNPVDRSYSHYHHNDKKYGPPKISFREMVQQELDLWESLGLSEANTAGTQARVWRNYKAMAPKGATLVARSLYVLQLRQWLGVLEDHFGEDIDKHLLIVESERLHHDVQGVMNEVWNFLGLGPFELSCTRTFHAHNYTSLDNATRAWLTEFYRPWNEQLDALLAPRGIRLSWAKT